MIEWHDVFDFSFPSNLSYSKHRCDGRSYSGNYEAILRTKATCQGQQTRKTKVAWDVVVTVETPYSATQPTVDFFYVRERVSLSYLNQVSGLLFQVSSLATKCNPNRSNRTFGTLHAPNKYSMPKSRYLSL